jgi:hypothetical protein
MGRGHLVTIRCKRRVKIRAAIAEKLGLKDKEDKQ